jgi:membrane associated rhomboid family serine protease
MFIFSLFSGNQKSSIKLVDTILDRIVLQSGFVYLQVKELNNVYLGIEGLDLKMFNSLFNHEYKNLSAITYESYYRNDYSGTTAGLSYAQLYYAFGFIGLLVAMLLTTIIGFIDEIFYKSINNNRNNKSFVFAFYVAFISFYYVNIFTNIFSIFSFPQIFSNMIWLIFILFLLMVKLKKGSLCYSYYTY